MDRRSITQRAIPIASAASALLLVGIIATPGCELRNGAGGAHALTALPSARMGDPAHPEGATLEAPMDEDPSIAWEQAQKWADLPDSATIPLAQVKPKYECEEKSGCTPTDSCKFDGYDKWAYCVVTGCGDGACPTCPDLFDISKLVVKSWCSYTCMVDRQIVGIKIALNVKLFKRLEKCLKLEKPVPCEGVCGT
jgi:hypothetical protein